MCTVNDYLKHNDKCNGDIFPLKSFSNHEKICILSECSLTLLQSGYTDKLTICNTHKEICAENLKRRRKRQTCGISAVNPLICCHTSSKAGDRHVSVEMQTNIARSAGVFIPVGTPICRLCREEVTKATTNYNGPVFDKHETVTEAEQTHLQEIRVYTGHEEEEDVSLAGRRKRTEDCLDRNDQFKRICVHDVEESSQSSTMSSLQTADSPESYASVMNISRLESLNTFLHNCNVSPVKSLSNPLTVASERTKRRYIDKAKECVFAVLETIAPKEKDLLLESIIFERNEQEQPANDTLQILKKIYIQAESWQFQRQVLSIIVQQMSFEGAQKFIPGLTSWRFYEAKRHANIEGPGLPVNVTAEKREKINANNLDHFIDFITSSHIMKDLPYGQRTLKLDSGEIINIPNVIRSLSSSSLISQYLQLCEEDNISPLGKSTLYKILSECAASVRKSVEGLDNYVMEGSRAFQTLEEIFMDENNLKTKLLEAKRYLKADFKIHLARQTNVIQHCLGFALSIPGIEFQLHCQHIHSQHCQSCIDLDETLQKVLENAEKKQIENKDALMFKVEKAVNDIKNLQKHIVRSKNQEFARKDIADNMEINDVIITSDWAMKCLPRRYREGQLDWFAKRGINWHVSVSLIKLQHRMQTLTHLHIFSSQTSQDAAVTTAVMTDVVQDLKTILPNLQNVHIFSDNAGCYKSSLTLSTLRHEIGKALASYNFSEAQNGKGPCDRRAAHAKFVIKRFINEGRDVTSALDKKKGNWCSGIPSSHLRMLCS